MPMVTRIRPARATDHGAYARLFLELATGDAVLEEGRFVAELVPTTLIAEDESGSAAGYAYFQVMKDLTYVRHVVTAPESRRCGVGRALMEAIAERARGERCTTWCLNVKLGNMAAIALYERMGMTPEYQAHALRITWSDVESRTVRSDMRSATRLIGPEDDAGVETAMQLLVGQLAAARATGNRVLLVLEEADEQVKRNLLGIAIFHPHFPGAYPFRVTRPELAIPLLRSIRPYARASDSFINIMVEGQPDVADALVAAGAVVRLEMVHMKGPLPGMV
jgi:GNAT superfamily N-acetyltransferase